MGSGLKRLCFPVMIAAIVALSPAWAEERPLTDLNLDWLKKKEEANRWGRDPFAFPMRHGAGGLIGAEGGLQLSAIIYRSGRGVAIINNRILRKGDVIEGVRIVEILSDRVILTDPSGTRELRVNRFAANP